MLSDIDFHVPAGAKLGILGETGAGKSTLVNLISRFYDPTAGRVLIDGIDARDWPLATLRSQVCIVAQDTFLFSDTIGSNISFGAGDRGNRLEYNGQYDGQRRRRGYDEQYVRRMAAIAGADGFISSMPDGYDTVVGERGVGLSGGQKQRLSLARALADNPSILIMDDTTSAVDMETEAEIQRHSARFGREEDDCHNRPPHFVGQGFRLDSRAGAWAHCGTWHARRIGGLAWPILADLQQAVGRGCRPLAGIRSVRRGGG